MTVTVNHRRTAAWYRSRIESILNLHAVLFDSPLIGLAHKVSDEYLSLEKFNKNPNPTTINRLFSIMKTHELLFAEGVITENDETRRELEDIIHYLSTLKMNMPTSDKKAAMIPENLGMRFAKKGLGFPLFGYYRPLKVPETPGVLICYQSPDVDEVALFEGVLTGGHTKISYLDKGIVVNSRTPWLYCAITPSGYSVLTPGSYIPGNGKSDIFSYSRFSAAVAKNKCKMTIKNKVVDPFRYQYAYFFFWDATLERRILRFLSDIFSGRFYIPLMEAQSLAGVFVDRLINI